MKKFYKKLFVFLSIICICLISGCVKGVDIDFLKKNKIEKIAKQEFEVCENDLLKGEATIYALKNQAAGQILSVVVIDEYKNAIVFDGGRVEDADFLYEFLKEKSDKKVYAWFLTHCHDDHVGALYTILDKYKEDIMIANFYYQFPSFDWLYNLIGADAGATILVDGKIKEYCELVKNKNVDFSKTITNCQLGQIHNTFTDDNEKTIFLNSDLCGITIDVINEPYYIEKDSLNNSSIVYKVSIEHFDKKNELKFNDGKIKEEKTSLIILGDLAYEGGEKLIIESGDILKSDICVMAHHGQGGVWKEVYEKINPKICIWPTIKKIYENEEKKYRTDEVKQWLDEIGVEKQYTTVERNIIIK